MTLVCLPILMHPPRFVKLRQRGVIAKRGHGKRTLNVADRNCYKTMFELKHRRLTLVSFNANMSFTNVIEQSPETGI
jgi:hypothetical protein